MAKQRKNTDNKPSERIQVNVYSQAAAEKVKNGKQASPLFTFEVDQVTEFTDRPNGQKTKGKPVGSHPPSPLAMLRWQVEQCMRCAMDLHHEKAREIFDELQKIRTRLLKLEAKK